MKPLKIQFPVGPGEFCSGILIKSKTLERVPVSFERFVEGKLQVQLPCGDWYEVKPEDFFGADA